MRKVKVRLFFIVSLLVVAVTVAAQSQNKIMRVYSGGSAVYGVNASQVDSVTFKNEEPIIIDPIPFEDLTGVWEFYPAPVSEPDIVVTLDINGYEAYAKISPPDYYLYANCGGMLLRDGQKLLIHRDTMFLVGPAETKLTANKNVSFFQIKEFTDKLALRYLEYIVFDPCPYLNITFNRKTD